MKILCFFNRHDWHHLEHFPDGDSFPSGYIARRCKRCERVQWNILPTVWLPEHAGEWINGWPKRANQKMLDEMLQQAVEAARNKSFEVKVELDPGLWPEEQGKP